MPGKQFRCLVCGQPEGRCMCIRYCAICQGDHDLRLWEDGQFYCKECREACDYKVPNRA